MPEGGKSPGLGTPAAAPAHAPALSAAPHAAALAAAEFSYAKREVGPAVAFPKDAAAPVVPRAVAPLASPAEIKKSSKVSIDTADFFAIGFLLLCIGALISGTIITIGMVYEKFDTTVGSALVGGFYGSPLLLGIIKAVLGEKKKSDS